MVPALRHSWCNSTQQDVVRAFQGAGKNYPQVTAVVTLPIPEKGGVVEKVAELVGVDCRCSSRR